LFKGVSLKSVKKYNTSLILQTILKNEHISRIQIAEQCSLSPSAVTSIVGDLIKKGILEETGTGKSTGGRKPIFVHFSKIHNVIIFELLREGISAYLYNLQHEQVNCFSLSSRLLTGNELFFAITSLLDDILGKPAEARPKILSIGILYPDNIPENELTVMYSTSVSSENISLEAALTSKYKIPVMKELSGRLSLSNYLSPQSNIACKNYAYVHIGEKITASITLDGIPVKIADRTIFNLGASKNVTEMRHLINHGSPSLDSCQTPKIATQNYANGLSLLAIAPPGTENNLEILEQVESQFAGLIQNICVFFPIELVLLDGKIFNAPDFIASVQRIIGNSPTINLINSPGKNTVITSLAYKLIEDRLVTIANN
jgi:predicted NBD/HSP70 family sugar kinase